MSLSSQSSALVLTIKHKIPEQSRKKHKKCHKTNWTWWKCTKILTINWTQNKLILDRIWELLCIRGTPCRTQQFRQSSFLTTKTSAAWSWSSANLHHQLTGRSTTVQCAPFSNDARWLIRNCTSEENARLRLVSGHNRSYVTRSKHKGSVNHEPRWVNEQLKILLAHTQQIPSIQTLQCYTTSSVHVLHFTTIHSTTENWTKLSSKCHG